MDVDIVGGGEENCQGGGGGELKVCKQFSSGWPFRRGKKSCNPMGRDTSRKCFPLKLFLFQECNCGCLKGRGWKCARVMFKLCGQLRKYFNNFSRESFFFCSNHRENATEAKQLRERSSAAQQGSDLFRTLVEFMGGRRVIMMFLGWWIMI